MSLCMRVCMYKEKINKCLLSACVIALEEERTERRHHAASIAADELVLLRSPLLDLNELYYELISGFRHSRYTSAESPNISFCFLKVYLW